MKYLKLFENWLNEADANTDKNTMDVYFQYFKKLGLEAVYTTEGGGGIKLISPDSKAIDLGKDIKNKFDVFLLDNSNPSNKKLKNGITLTADMSYPGVDWSRWTLNPMDIINCKLSLSEAQQIKSFLQTKFSEYLATYGAVTLEGGMAYGVYYNGKYSKYWENGTTSWNVKPMRQTFTKEDIKAMKKNAVEGRRFLEKMLTELENMGKNFFAYEFKKASGFPSGYKLTASLSKDQSSAWGGDYNLSTADLLKNIQEIHGEMKYKFDSIMESPSIAKLNAILYGAVSYGLAKASFIEEFYTSEKYALGIVGMYGNIQNQYMAEIEKTWNTIQDNIKLAYSLPNTYNMESFAPLNLRKGEIRDILNDEPTDKMKDEMEDEENGDY